MTAEKQPASIDQISWLLSRILREYLCDLLGRPLTTVRHRRTIVRIMRTIRKQDIDWLFPRVRRAVLAVMLSDPGQRRHLRDVARRTGCAVGSVRRELAGLAACGILTAAREGNRTYYQAAPQCPIHSELCSIIRKTCGLGDVVRAALAPLARKITIAFVYGSQAAGTAGSSSDVDLMVIGKAPFAQVVAALASVQDQLGREVNPTVYSHDEFRTKIASGHHFVSSVMKGPKIFLIGDADDLAELGK